MNKEIFYVITMLTKGGKTLYLTMHTDNGRPAWTFMKEDACIWNFEEEAINFGNKWFKKFKEWKTQEIQIVY